MAEQREPRSALPTGDAADPGTPSGGPGEAPNRRAELLRRALGLALVAAAGWTALVNFQAKGTLDAYPFLLALWLLASWRAIRRTNSAIAFAAAVLALLVLDAVANVFALGSWLRAPWRWLNAVGWTLLGRPLIAEWRWDLGAEASLPAYWTTFWGIAVSLRTLALLSGVAAAASGWRQRLAVSFCLAAATLALYASPLQSALCLALLGYPPILTRAPLGLAYPPPLLGAPWDAARAVASAGLGLIVAILLFDLAIALERRGRR
mgnify:CR=1 FL=1